MGFRLNVYPQLLLILVAGLPAFHCKDPDIIVFPRKSDVFLTKGASFKMDCSVKTDENYIVRWVSSNGGKNADVFTSEVPDVGTDDTIIGHTATLTIVDFKMSLTYKCELMKKNISKVLNTFPVKFRIVTEEVTDALFKHGMKEVNLACKISIKNASATIGEPKWNKNGTDITADDAKFEIIKTNHSLIIKDVKRIDAGVYTADYPIEIDGTNFMYGCNVPLNAGPMVLEFDKSKNLIEEDKLDLRCKVLGYPHAQISWFKDDVMLTGVRNVTKHIFSPLWGYMDARLLIKSVAFSDAGDYKCVAKSLELNESSSQMLTVRVKDKYAALWPFLGIVGEVIVLCTIIFIYEKRRSKQADREDAGPEENDGTVLDREGLRHRNAANNPRA